MAEYVLLDMSGRKRYELDSVLDYIGDILLVGINYDKKTKEHQCLIERYEKK